MTEQEKRDKLTEAADKFATEVKEFLDVKEIVYLVAFEDDDDGRFRLATGSTETAPEALRHEMLSRAAKLRK